MYQRREITTQEKLQQEQYCQRVRARIAHRPHYAMVDTYGCQQNESDSEILRGWLVQCGYTLTEDEDKADLIAVNTCAVREHAEKRVLGNVGALAHKKAKNPELLVCVGGCMTQQATVRERIRKSYQVVDLVFGPHEVWQFPELCTRPWSAGADGAASAGSSPRSHPRAWSPRACPGPGTTT